MKRSGNYQTKARQSILEFFEKNDDKIITASDIYIYMEDSGNRINKTTIYRYLEQLKADGQLITYISEKGGKSGYHFVNSGKSCHEHLHLKCLQCGKVQHLDCDFMEELRNHISENHSFRLQCDNSILYGVCDSCSVKNAEKILTAVTTEGSVE